ncbi:MAG: hypothetical protein IT334_05455 [Thermomicrobiales bacterium]|nr:hypothetical protein [Thermomicrobiales bacterium]
MTEATDRNAIKAEMQRTAFQKNAVSKMKPAEVLEYAIAWFTERGYKSGKSARPNHVFVLGGKEGLLPRVTGEIAARGDVGKPGTTLVTVDAAGELLGPSMKQFLADLRAHGRALQKPAE